MLDKRSDILDGPVNGDWPVTGLKTTTEVWRHQFRLERLFEQAALDGITNGRMIEIGPGAAVSFLAGGLSRPAEKSMSWEEFRFQAFRFAESALRHVPWMPLRSLEPQEIVNLACSASENNILGELVVVDRDRRVLEAARSAVTRNSNVQAGFVQFDVNSALDWTLPKAHLVCAYKCSHLLEDPSRLFDSVGRMITDGGLFSTTDAVRHQNFLPIDEAAGLYRYALQS